MYENDYYSTQFQNQTATSTSWQPDINTILLILVVIFIVNTVFGLITMAIAARNERDKPTAFVAGFFMGMWGVIMYAIMGETVELRVAIEEKERRRLATRSKN